MSLRRAGTGGPDASAERRPSLAHVLAVGAGVRAHKADVTGPLDFLGGDLLPALTAYVDDGHVPPIFFDVGIYVVDAHWAPEEEDAEFVYMDVFLDVIGPPQVDAYAESEDDMNAVMNMAMLMLSHYFDLRLKTTQFYNRTLRTPTRKIERDRNAFVRRFRIAVTPAEGEALVQEFAHFRTAGTGMFGRIVSGLQSYFGKRFFFVDYGERGVSHDPDPVYHQGELLYYPTTYQAAEVDWMCRVRVTKYAWQHVLRQDKHWTPNRALEPPASEGGLASDDASSPHGSSL